MKRIGLMIALLLAAFAAPAAPTVTLTSSTTSAISPASYTLTWSSTEALTCAASGAWTGTKPTSGTQSFTNQLATKTFNLSCMGATLPAVLTWTAPTQNTDGSPIPTLPGDPGALAKYKIFHAASTTGIATAVPIEVDASMLTYSVAGLPAGPRYFAMKATTVAGIDSDFTPSVSKVVAGETASGSVTVTVNTKPLPPVVTIAVAAYEGVQSGDRVLLGRRVGSIELGVGCIEPALIAESFYEVPKAAVVPSIPPGQFRKVKLVVTQCAAPALMIG
jgi:hypothetical protein